MLWIKTYSNVLTNLWTGNEKLKELEVGKKKRKVTDYENQF